MADSTSRLDLIAQNQAQKHVTSNNLSNAASPAMMYALRPNGAGGLTWAYYGGVANIAGTLTAVANGAVTLTASATNYVEADPADGSVSCNTTGYSAGAIPLYTVVTDASAPTSYTDHRAYVLQAGYADADQAAAGAISASFDQAEVQAVADLANALRAALIDAGVIKGGA